MYDFHLKQKNSPYTSDYHTACTTAPKKEFCVSMLGSTVKWFNNEKGYTFITI